MVEGRCDTPAGWTLALPQVVICDNLVTQNTSVAWIRVLNLWALLTILVYSTIRITQLAILQVGAATAYAICELLAFDVPAARVLVQAAADTRVINDVKAYFPLTGHNLTVADLEQEFANLPATIPQNLPGARNWGANTDQDKAAMVPDIDTAWAICYIVAKVRFTGTSQVIVTSIYVCFLCAIAKMGTLSDKFIEKITTRVQDEINISLDPNMFAPDVCKMIWNTIKGYVTEANIGTYVARWIGAPAVGVQGTAGYIAPVIAILPDYALSLKIVAQQIRGEGLTALSTIKKAVMIAPTFPWDEVAAMFPGEVQALITALNAIGGNAYYGYIHDTTTVKSTNYKNVAWIAKEILIRLGGNSSLKQYKGWMRTPLFHAVLDTMIDTYIQNIPPPVVTQAISQNAVALTNALNAATGLSA